MKSVASKEVSLVLIVMAAASLFSMIGLLQIDKIVHGDLYNYGLHFSYKWAIPYWTIADIIFGMGWLNIISAVAFQVYILTARREETPSQVKKTQAENLQTQAPQTKIAQGQEEPEHQPQRDGETQRETTQTPTEKKTETQETPSEQPAHAETQKHETETEKSDKDEGPPILTGL